MTTRMVIIAGNPDTDDPKKIAEAYLLTSAQGGYDLEADLNFDGKIDNADLDILSAAWGLSMPSDTYYFHFDATGNVIALTDSNGATVEMYRYSAFGSCQILDPEGDQRSASLYRNPYLFTARRYDEETGLYYYRARMYNPAIGRFLQTDPIGYADGINWYTYCANNPIMLIDPSGLCGQGSSNSLFGEVWKVWRKEGAWRQVYSNFIDEFNNALTLGIYDKQGWYTTPPTERRINEDWMGKTGRYAANTAAAAGAILTGVAAGEVIIGAISTDVVTGGNVTQEIATRASTTTLYHGGTLNNGAVNATSISLTSSLQHAQQYAEINGGQVWQFNVPTQSINQGLQTGIIQPLMDMYYGTNTYAPEFRFYGEAAGALNQFIQR
jgi:RHS repeat-associated protein